MQLASKTTRVSFLPEAPSIRAAAERIKGRMKRTVEDIIEIGRELTAVKDRLEQGQFLPWINVISNG